MAKLASAHTYILDPTADRYLTLGSEEWLRKLTIGNSWSTIRIGAHFALTPDSTNNLTACSLCLGICSASSPFASTLGLSSATTTNYVGADIFGDGSGNHLTATYNAGAGNPYFTCGGGFFNITKRVGSTTTYAQLSNIASSCRIMPAGVGSLIRRSAAYVDIIKGSPNYTVKIYIADATSGTDFSYSHFVTGFETATPVLNGVTFTQFGSQTIATSEAAGNFDTVSVYWNRASFPMELYAVAAARLA